MADGNAPSLSPTRVRWWSGRSALGGHGRPTGRAGPGSGAGAVGRARPTACGHARVLPDVLPVGPGASYRGAMMENLDTEPVVPALDLTVLDCPDALQLATFYAKLLGWRVEEGSDADWAELLPPGGRVSADEPGGQPSLAFQRIDDFQRPTWPTGSHPQQFHLDLSVTDIDAAEPRALALGATVHDHQPSASGSFRVYVDPAGHPFCFTQAV